MSKPPKSETPKSDLTEQIKIAVGNLYYVSETNAEILPFVGSKATKALTINEIRCQTQTAPEVPIEEKDFLYAPYDAAQLVRRRGTSGGAEITDLQNLLQENLRDLTVFKIDKIQIDIYAVGFDGENISTGIRRKPSKLKFGHHRLLKIRAISGISKETPSKL